MIAPAFVDTNVLFYWLDLSSGSKRESASLWLAHLWTSRSGRLSYQVLQEFFDATTRKRPEIREQVQTEIRRLLAWRPIPVNGLLLDRAWKIQDRYQLSFWDSLIIAAAHAASCRWLLTEDLQDGQSIDGVTVVNPFRTTPDQLFS